MDEAIFRRDRTAEGYEEFNVIDWPPGQVNRMHTHPFRAHVLVLAGEISVATHDGPAKVFRPGATFALDGGVPHEETVGPEGVRVLSARKHTPTP